MLDKGEWIEASALSAHGKSSMLLPTVKDAERHVTATKEANTIVLQVRMEQQQSTHKAYVCMTQKEILHFIQQRTVSSYWSIHC